MLYSLVLIIPVSSDATPDESLESVCVSVISDELPADPEDPFDESEDDLPELLLSDESLSDELFDNPDDELPELLLSDEPLSDELFDESEDDPLLLLSEELREELDDPLEESPEWCGTEDESSLSRDELLLSDELLSDELLSELDELLPDELL